MLAVEPTGTALVTLTGPVVPEGTPALAPSVSVSFRVDVVVESGTVSVPSGFSALDDLGAVHALSGPALHSVAAGSADALMLTATLPSGEGKVRWSPGAGAPTVAWDYTLEVD